MHFYISRVYPSLLFFFSPSATAARAIRRDLFQREVQNRAFKDILLQRA